MEPRYNDPLYNEVLGITNDVLYPNNSKKNLNIMKPGYFEQILPLLIIIIIIIIIIVIMIILFNFKKYVHNLEKYLE